MPQILPTSDPAGAQIAALRQNVCEGHLPADEQLRDLWRVAGGTLERVLQDPRVTDRAATMPEEFLLLLLRTLFAQS